MPRHSSFAAATTSVAHRPTAIAPLVVLDGVLAPRVCRDVIAQADTDQWLTSTAEIDSVTASSTLAPRRVSNPARALGKSEPRPRFAVVDAPLLALRLFYRLVAELPLSRQGAELAGLKPLFRCTEYRCGEGTRQHCDPERETHEGQRSQLSVVVFLNEGYRGGAIEFPELGERIEPRRGRVCVFPHGLSHVDLTVESGRKFVLETEVFYDSAWGPYRS